MLTLTKNKPRPNPYAFILPLVERPFLLLLGTLFVFGGGLLGLGLMTGVGEIAFVGMVLLFLGAFFFVVGGGIWLLDGGWDDFTRWVERKARNYDRISD